VKYQKRIAEVRTLLQDSLCDSLIVDETINLYYLTGCNLSTGRLLIHQEGAVLLVDNRYIEMCKKISPFPVLLSEENPLESVLSSAMVTDMEYLGFDSETTSHKNFLELGESIKKSGRSIGLVPLNNPIKQVRAIKDEEEIQLLKDAAKLGSEGFDYICNQIKEGITEKEIASDLEIFWKKRGGDGLAFDPIIAFGVNSSMPHYRGGEVRLQKKQAVLLDIGVNLKGYHSDMTRVVFLGEPDPKMLEIYNIVKEAQQAALKLCKPGTLIGALDDSARSYISSHGYGENFGHGLGHGVGLEIHENPVLRNKPPFNTQELMPGMVITIEPGIYLPSIGGVRIEDTVVITKQGYENLTNRSTELKIL
jgi:Xaa-Pro aminopeptidase